MMLNRDAHRWSGESVSERIVSTTMVSPLVDSFSLFLSNQAVAVVQSASAALPSSYAQDRGCSACNWLLLYCAAMVQQQQQEIKEPTLHSDVHLLHRLLSSLEILSVRVCEPECVLAVVWHLVHPIIIITQHISVSGRPEGEREKGAEKGKAAAECWWRC